MQLMDHPSPPSLLSKTFTLLILLLAPLTTYAANISFNLQPTSLLPNPSTLPSSTKATLFRHSNTFTTLLTKRNTFDFTSITPGSYLFTIQCRDYTFGPLRVDVSSLSNDSGGGDGRERVEGWQTFWGNEWGNKGELKGSGDVGIKAGEWVVIPVKAEKAKEYYTERVGFSPLSFLKSPMILMALFSLVMIVGIPYLTENMDEETKAEFEEMQKKSAFTQATNAAAGGGLQNFDLASWMAGRNNNSGGGKNSGGSGDDTEK